MQKVLILLATADDQNLTRRGQELLRDFHISFQIRVTSAQLASDYAKDLVENFQKDGGSVIICVASPQDPLAPLVSSWTHLPILQVLVSSPPVFMEPPRSGPLPVATLGLGADGFSQAALFSIQLLAMQDTELNKNVQRHRHSLAAQMIAADQKYQVIFDV